MHVEYPITLYRDGPSVFIVYFTDVCFLAYTCQINAFAETLLCNTHMKLQDCFLIMTDNPESMISIACFIVDIYPVLVVTIILLSFSGKHKVSHVYALLTDV